MKKLIIAAAIAFAGVAAQASTVNWGLNSGTALDATKFASGTAYFIAVDDLARPTTLTDATAGDWYKANIATVKSSALITSATVADGVFYKANDDALASADRARQNYWLLIDNDATSDADHYFAVSTLNKGVTFNSSSSISVTATWNGGTQMSTFAAASVPEPTSGLMLLLGVAGLALRRRRA